MKGKIFLANTAVLFVTIGIFLVTGTASAQMFLGSGPGCSAIGGVNVTDLADGDSFTGRIGTTGVSGVNPAGKPVGDPDEDGFTDSLEECINDSLIGFCTTLNRDDSDFISVAPGATSGRKLNKQEFTVTFDDVSRCGITECSDQVNNDGDTLADFPADLECTDYDDNDESA